MPTEPLEQPVLDATPGESSSYLVPGDQVPGADVSNAPIDLVTLG